MSDNPSGAADRAFQDRVERFAEALERLVDLVGFYVAGDDGVWLFPELDQSLDATLRQAFHAADRARWAVGIQPWGLGFGAVPAEWGPVAAGLRLHASALTDARRRWRCPQAWLKDDDGAVWLGRAYPDDFPARQDTIRPRELELLKRSLKLLRLPIVGAPPRPVEVEPAAAFGSVKLYGPDKSPIVRGVEKSSLTPARYMAVLALILALKVKFGSANPRASAEEIRKKYTRPNTIDPSEISRRLGEVKRLDPDWGASIDLAGTPHRGYYLN